MNEVHEKQLEQVHVDGNTAVTAELTARITYLSGRPGVLKTDNDLMLTITFM